jgi:hypothetical protein
MPTAIAEIISAFEDRARRLYADGDPLLKNASPV